MPHWLVLFRLAFDKWIEAESPNQYERDQVLVWALEMSLMGRPPEGHALLQLEPNVYLTTVPRIRVQTTYRKAHHLIIVRDFLSY